MVDKYDKFVLIDLRGQAQIERGYLEFQIEKNVPDKDTKLVLYCCSGKRSILAAESLMKMGYTDVSSLRGGVIEWVDKDFPLDTSFGEMVSTHEQSHFLVPLCYNLPLLKSGYADEHRRDRGVVTK